MAWTDQAACRDTGDELWFPSSAAVSRETAPIARAYCRWCPVRVPCLEEEMDAEGDTPAYLRFGIRGGLDPQERYALRLERNPELAERRRAASLRGRSLRKNTRPAPVA